MATTVALFTRNLRGSSSAASFPLRHALRYDPGGAYVRHYVPELAGLDVPAVHEPWRLPDDQRRALDYPEPIVDLAEATERFRAARGR